MNNSARTSAETSNETLRKNIEDFYLPRHLVRAIYDIGAIPAHSQESHVGVGFIDIADYTYLSKFLSPKENQILLNGLYTAFQMVLERHGGFLNKIEGDSMMFQFDGVIDKRMRGKEPQESLEAIAKELFYTCVEMQRVCVLFNEANDRFMDESASTEAKLALKSAFEIISNLRGSHDASSALHAFFQIRIRIGANIGEVTIGNFGPDGAKHWDVIGIPVINAKRMEMTAPVGGLRISEEFYRILEKSGLVRDYHSRFKREAMILGSVYRDIGIDELFSFREVVIREKKGAAFRTFSVQVNPGLPEAIGNQSEKLLEHGPQGASRILEMIQYYRGNKYVIDRLEQIFNRHGIKVRKDDILTIIVPKRNAGGGSWKAASEYSLFELLQIMDTFQDAVQKGFSRDSDFGYEGYDATLSRIKENVLKNWEIQKNLIMQKNYFFEVVYPLVYTSLRTSILEFQATEGIESLLETTE